MLAELDSSGSDQLELLTEFQARVPREVHVQVRLRRIGVGARPLLLRKVYAVYAREAQLETSGLVAKSCIDQCSHVSLEWLRRLPALEEKIEVARDGAGERVRGLLAVRISELTRIREGCVEGRLGQPVLRRAFVQISAE